MSQYTPAWPHGELSEVFPDIFVVTGTNKTNFGDIDLQFSRNMQVVREGTDLTLINAVRLDDSGLAKLESLGKVKNIVRIGAFHGRDDLFYLDRYPDAKLWALPNAVLEHGETIDVALQEDGPTPFSNCSLFIFKTSKHPECILHLDREGGILFTCDSLQNFTGPDEFFDQPTAEYFSKIGMFNCPNVGVMWMKACKPAVSDIEQLRQLSFNHLLSAHGKPLKNDADAVFGKIFKDAEL